MFCPTCGPFFLFCTFFTFCLCSCYLVIKLFDFSNYPVTGPLCVFAIACRIPALNQYEFDKSGGGLIIRWPRSSPYGWCPRTLADPPAQPSSLYWRGLCAADPDPGNHIHLLHPSSKCTAKEINCPHSLKNALQRKRMERDLVIMPAEICILLFHLVELSYDKDLFRPYFVWKVVKGC